MVMILKHPLKWWRAFVGALLAFVIVAPYMMGASVEKYVLGWMDAINVQKGPYQLELQNYQRHWFSSDGDLVISGPSLSNKFTVHFKAYHGPLFFNAGATPRLGLSYFTASIDTQVLLGMHAALKIDGPIQFTALVPYYNDREVHMLFPPVTFTDKENHLVYNFDPMESTLESDGQVQIVLPALLVKHNGDEMFEAENGLLRLLPDSHQASFTAKQVIVPIEIDKPVTINNLLIQATTQTNDQNKNQLQIDLKIQLEQFKHAFNQASIETGPFDFKLTINGLNSQGLSAVANTLKAVSTQANLTPEQGEAFEKGLASTFSRDTSFDLNSELNTTQGKVSAQFQGGFKPKTALQSSEDVVDAFYSKGSITMTAGVMQALSEYAAKLKPVQGDEAANNQSVAITTLLGFLKPNAQGYAMAVDVRDGKIILNGKDVKSNL